MKKTPITKVLTTNCVVIEAKTNLHSIQDLFNHFPNRFLPVVNGLKFVGVIFRDEFFQKCLYGNENARTAKDYVSKEIVKLSPNNTIEEAKEVFDTAVFDMIPVTDSDGDLMGILLRDDVETAYRTFFNWNWNWQGTTIRQRVMSLLTF